MKHTRNFSKKKTHQTVPANVRENEPDGVACRKDKPAPQTRTHTTKGKKPEREQGGDYQEADAGIYKAVAVAKHSVLNHERRKAQKRAYDERQDFYKKTIFHFSKKHILFQQSGSGSRQPNNELNRTGLEPVSALNF